MSVFLFALCLCPIVSSLPTELLPATTSLKVEEDKNDVGNKSLQFVDSIKDNLRKNNDDYNNGKLIEGDDDTEQAEVDGRRRYNGSLLVHSDPAYKHTISISLTPVDAKEKLTKILKSEKKRRPKLPRHVRRDKTTKTTDKDVKEIKDEGKRKENVNKWKELVEKSKKLHDYTSTPRIEPTTVPIIPTVTFDRMTSRKRFQGRARNASKPVFAFPVRLPGAKRAPPSADQLDMAPARGAYIHDLRLKGRFCHRHVLWPEGPKYDSKGNTIMPMFDNKRYGPPFYHREFHNTLKPHYVLPRCCNCCKKSVIGCQ